MNAIPSSVETGAERPFSDWQDEQRRRQLGRNDLPGLLEEMWEDGQLEDLDDLAEAVADAWTSADLPLLTLTRHDWVGFFRLLDYTVDGRRDAAMRPASTMTLYRAATRFDLRNPGLSWTPDPDRARFFQRYNSRYERQPLLLLRVQAEPRHFLARFHEARQENEYLVSVSNRHVDVVSD